MARDTIPVPAESARQVAISASENITKQRDKNLKNNAADIERGISHILDKTAGNDGEFVSLDADHVSHVLAFSEEFSYHSRAVNTFLEQYNIW